MYHDPASGRGIILQSDNGAVTSNDDRSMFLVEFGNVALTFSREELYEFIAFLDQVELPDRTACCCEDERVVIVEGSRFGVILMFTVAEFAELYELLIDLQIEDSSTIN